MSRLLREPLLVLLMVATACFPVYTQCTNPDVTIDLQPINLLVFNFGDQTASLTIAATCASGATPSYQWQRSGDNGNTWSNISVTSIYSGVNTPVLTFTDPPFSFPPGAISNLNGSLYRCKVTSSNDVSCPVFTDRTALQVYNASYSLINASGGGSPSASDLRVYVGHTGQLQVLTRGSNQLYEPGSSPQPLSSNSQLYNGIYLSVGGKIFGPRSAWASTTNEFKVIRRSGGSNSGDGKVNLVYRAVDGGLNYDLEIDYDYVFPNPYVNINVVVKIPAGNSKQVKVYHSLDTYLSGSDTGPAFKRGNPVSTVGVLATGIFEGWRYIGGLEWTGYYSADYLKMYNDYIALSKNFTNFLDFSPSTDNGIGWMYDFGENSPSGNFRFNNDLIFSADLPPARLKAEDDLFYVAVDSIARSNVLDNDNSDDPTVTSKQVLSFTIEGEAGPFELGNPYTIVDVGDFTLNTDGTFTLIPVAGFIGDTPRINYAADNLVGPGSSAALTITAVNPDFPSWVSQAADTLISCMKVGVQFNDRIMATGTPAPSYEISSGTLPAGLTINKSNGEITGTPTTSGSYSFTVKASNLAGNSEQQFSGYVYRGKQATLGQMKVGTPVTATVNPESVDLNFTLVSGSLPDGLTLNSTTGAVTGTPTKAGRFNFLISVVTPDGCDFNILLSEFVATSAVPQLYTAGAAVQVGTADLGDQNCPTLVAPPASKSWLTVVAGNSHSMALTADGQLWVWGGNSNGQLGLADLPKGTLVQAKTPRQVCLGGSCSSTQPVWKYISAGAYNSYAITRDGKMYAWGKNDNGQCGTGTSTGNSGSDNLIPVLVTTVPGERWVTVDAGYDHVVALAESGKLYAWGSKWFGQMGDGVTTGKQLAPVRIGPSDKIFVRAVGGYNHSAAITTDGEMYLWGSNQYGQIGDNSTIDRNAFTRVASDKIWVEVSPREGHTLAIDSEGDLYSWGLNTDGQLGLGNTINFSAPQLVDASNNWVVLPAGAPNTSSSAAITDEGLLYTWGKNTSGLLGNCSFLEKPTIPKRVGESVQWLTFSQSSAAAMGTGLPMISLDKDAIHLIQTGAGVAVTATVAASLTDKTVTSSITNESVATIDASGKVVPGESGVTTFKASVSQGKFFKSASVFVNRLPLRIDQIDPDLKCGSKILEVSGYHLFFGQNSGTHISFNSGLNNIDYKDEFTFEASVLIYDHVSGQRIIDMKGANGELFYITTSGGFNGRRLSVTFNTGVNGIKRFDSFDDFTTNTWNHVAVTFSAIEKTARLYINGKLAGIGTDFYEKTPLSMGPTTSNYIGRSNTYSVSGASTGNFLVGLIDEVRMWNVVRTEYELFNTIGMQLPGTYPGIISMLNLEEGRGKVLSDTKPGSLVTNVTLEGVVEWRKSTSVRSPTNMKVFSWSNGAGSQGTEVTESGSYTVFVTDYYNQKGRMEATTVVNACPVAVDDQITGIIGNVSSGNVISNDSDAEGPVVVSSVFYGNVEFTPANDKITVPISGKGVLEMGIDGATTFTPDVGYYGIIKDLPVTIKDSNGAKSTSFLQIVTRNVVTIDRTILVLYEGSDPVQLNASVGTEITDKTVTWSVKDPSIATVDNNGVVSPVSVGNTTVTVTTAEGGFKVFAAIFVKPKPKIGVSASNNCGDATLGAGGSTLLFDGGDPNPWTNFFSPNPQNGTYVTLPNNLESTPDFTFEAWVYINEHRTWQRIVDFGNNSTVYFFLTTTPGVPRPRFAISVSGIDGEEKLNSNTELPVKQWTHLAISIQGNRKIGIMYMNGNEVARNTNMTLNPTKLGATVNNFLGKSQYNVDPFLNGKLDEVRLWSVARTQQEIQGGLNIRFPANYPDMINYYKLDEATGTVILDESAGGNQGTIFPGKYESTKKDPWEIVGSSPCESFLDYKWSTGATTRSIVASASGQYSVALTDVFGVKFNASVNVTLNSCPSAAPDIAFTQQNTPVSGKVTTNDSDAEGPLSVTGIIVRDTIYSAINGVTTVTIKKTGTIVFQPDGNYVFTPQPAFAGNVPVITVRLKDLSNASVTSALTITVNGPPATVADSKSIPEDTTVPTSSSVLANDSDPNGDAFQVVSISVQGVTITPSQGVMTRLIAGVGNLEVKPDGTYTFIPVPDFNGTVPTVTYTVDDSKGGISSGVLNITITPVNDAPVAVDDSASGPEDAPVSGNLIANDSDIDKDQLSVTQVTVDNQTYTPFGGMIVVSITGKGSLSVKTNGDYTFTPVANYFGTLPVISYKLSDGNGGIDDGLLNITIISVNDAPFAYSNAYSADEENAIVGNVLTDVNALAEVDSDVEKDAFSLTGFSVNGQDYVAGTTATLQGIGTLVMAADGGFTFTPVKDYNGTVPQVTYRIKDVNNGVGSSTLALTINAINDAPVATVDSKEVEEDTQLTGNVLANDSDVDGDVLTVSSVIVNGVESILINGEISVTLTGIGTLVIKSNGDFTFTPDSNYFGEVTGITYKVSDGKGGEDVKALSIKVNSVNDSPVAYPNDYSADEENAIVGNVLTDANALAEVDSDVEKDAFSLTGFSVNGQDYVAGTTATLQGIGTLVMAADGGFTFTPVKDYNGTVPQVTYKIKDVNNGEGSSTLDLTINAVNDAPVATVDNKEVEEDTQLTGNVLANDSDVDGDVLTVSSVIVNGVESTLINGEISVTLTGIGTLVIKSNGDFTFTPDSNYFGEVTGITYKVSDGKGGEDVKALSIKVNSVNDSPVAYSNDYAADEDNAIDGNVITDANASAEADSDVENDVISVTGFSVGGQDYAAGTTATLEGVGTLVMAADGGFTFTPVKDYNGTVPQVTYKIKDVNNGEGSSTLDLTINSVNDAPVASDDNKEVSEDTPLTGNILDNDSDVDGDLITITEVADGLNVYTATNGVFGISFPGKGDLVLKEDGTYTFTPVADYFGTLPELTYKISDGLISTVTGLFNITVLSVNDAPVATDDSGSEAQGNPVSGILTANDSDTENDALSVDKISVGGNEFLPDANGVITAVISGTGTLVVQSDGSYVLTPDPGFYGIVTDIYYSLKDNGGAESALPGILKLAFNGTPLLAGDRTGMLAGNDSSGNLLDNDSDPDGGNLAVSQLSDGASTITPDSNGAMTLTITGKGILSVNTDGSYSFQPDSGFSGSFTVTIQTCDDGTPSACAKSELLVNVNGFPMLTDDSSETPQDHIVSGNALGNDSDPDKDLISVTEFTLNGTNYSPGASAEWAGVGFGSVNSDGTYSFTPAPGFMGEVEVGYKVCDDNDPVGCASAVLRILVTPSDARGDINVAFANMAANGNVSINDDLAYPVTYGKPVAVSGPAGAVVNLTMNTDGTYVFKANLPGVYRYDVPVCSTSDQGDACPTERLSITILDKKAESNDPVVNPDIIYVKPEHSVTLRTLANDGPGTIGANLDVSSVSLVSQPVNGTAVVDPLTGDILYTPNPGFRGIERYTYTVCDDKSPARCSTAEQEIIVTFSDRFNLTIAADDYASTLEGATVSGNILTNDYDHEGNTVTVTARNLNLPEGKFNLGSDGAYSFEPALGFAGLLNITYKVCDDGNPSACADASLYLLVKPFEPRPDFGATLTGIPIKGTIVTNDMVFSGARYELESADVSNPAGASLQLNPDGSYVFTTPNPGVYVFVCRIVQELSGSGGTGGRLAANTGMRLPYRTLQSIPSKPVILTITVLDPNATDNPPIANTDIVSTIEGQEVTVKSLSNDFAGSIGLTLVPSSISIVSQPSNGSVGANVQNGNVVYKPASGFIGVDFYTYRICDSQTPAKCATATQQVTVLDPSTPNTTLAADDFNVAQGPVPVTGNVLFNDTDPQGNSLETVEQNLNVTDGTFVLKADGSYTFTATLGFTGQVEFPYTIVDNGTPSANASATLYILVNPSSIDAVNNDFNSVPVNGFTGGFSGNVYLNDLVNGLQLQASQVSLTLLSNGGLVGASIAADGKVNVPASTPAGTFTVTYRICQVAVPSVCDEAEAIVKVIPPVLQAANDDYTDEIISNELGGSVGSVYDNDQISGVNIDPALRPNLTPTISNDGGLTGVTIDADGEITVPKNFEPGTYTITVQICEKLNPTNCAQATVTIRIEYTELVAAGGVTPNGDGLNDFFHIRGLTAFPDNQLVIVNRWGNVVFKANGYKNDWDGRSTNGLTVSGSEKVPAGTYFFVLQTGTGKKISGNFYIAY